MTDAKSLVRLANDDFACIYEGRHQGCAMRKRDSFCPPAIRNFHEKIRGANLLRVHYI